MPSTKTTTRTIRIRNETAEYFKGKPLNRAVDSVCALIQSGKLRFDDEEITITERNGGMSSVHTEIADEVMHDLSVMCNLYRVSVSEMITELQKSLDDGALIYENGRLIGVSDVDLERLEEVCHEKNIDVQSAIDKLVKEMWR